MADMAMQPLETKRLAVVSPFGNLRGIYVSCGLNEGMPAFTRLMKDGMVPDATTCIYYTSVFSTGAKWYFGKYLPVDKLSSARMESFCSAPGDAQSPEAASWPGEDIFEIREATKDDEENEYFFPGPSRRRPSAFNSGGRDVDASMDKHLMVLGLTRVDFNMNSVRAAYRKLALQLHPDRGGDKEQFQAMQNAYEAVVQALQENSRSGEAESGQPEQPRQSEAQSGYPSEGNDTEQIVQLSDAERDVRRQKAMEAALRRQGQGQTP